MNNKLIVFDLDGTLNQTNLHSVPAQTQALKEFNAPFASAEKIISTFGATHKEYTQILLPNFTPEERMAYLRRVAEIEDVLLEKNAKPFEGIPEMLDELRNQNILTAVCSNASTRYITNVLKALKLLDKIDYIQHLVDGCTKVETLGMLLEKVKPEKAIMVGDTSFDMDAAKENNIDFIACMYGFRPHEVNSSIYKAENANEVLNIINKILKD